MPDTARDWAATLHRRVTAALADLDSITARHRRGVSHRDECGTCNETYPCQTVQAVIRIRRTLTGEDTDHA